MNAHVDTIIVGQGLAGSAVAWQLHWSGRSVLIVDRSEPNTASRVAAGLITPITGRRWVRSEAFDCHWSAAVRFYRRVETEVGMTVFAEVPMLRLFASAEERTEYLERGFTTESPDLSEWEGRLQRGGQPFHGVRMQPAGRLNVREYQNATARFFEQRSEYVCANLNLPGDVVIDEQHIAVPRLDVTADQIVFCTGFEPNQWFPEVPDNPSRGDILNVSVENYQPSEVVHRGIWIAPETDETLTVGATYDWHHRQPEPRPAGRTELLDRLADFVDGPVSVHEHKAAVRPTMKDYEPVIGRHIAKSNVWILNGLGSKGALRSPLLAQKLVNSLLHNDRIEATIGYARISDREDVRTHPSLTQVAQNFVAEVVQSGETVIDATVGNGFDTSFLANLVGDDGCVIGFDIQQAAIEATTKRLQANSLSNVRLIHRGHEHLSEEVNSTDVSAVMFNLGYLPRADKSLITRPETTRVAVEQALASLRPGGIMTILAYRGHSGGIEECAAVEFLLSGLDEDLQVERVNSRPPKQASPVLFAVRKKVSLVTPPGD